MPAAPAALMPTDAPSLIEPARLEAPSPAILDLVADLAAAAGALSNVVHPRAERAFGDLVRIMDTHYSNRMAGHEADPRDIARALVYDFSTDPRRRHLQEEAGAHVRVLAVVDNLAAATRVPEPASRAFLCWLHHDYYLHAPEEMLRLPVAGREVVMAPGQWRNRPEHDQLLNGDRKTPAFAALGEVMAYFETRYKFEGLGTSARTLAIPAAHHRLDAVHPFPEGNGRVTRLMSHAMLMKAGLGARGLWSLSRGLALGLEERSEYPQALASDNLESFVQWFLRVCLDQVAFMTRLFKPAELAPRLKKLVHQSGMMRVEAVPLLEEALVRGEITAAEAPRLSGLAERHARRTIEDLQRAGLLAAETADGPLSLRFPMQYLDLLFPRLHSS